MSVQYEHCRRFRVRNFLSNFGLESPLPEGFYVALSDASVDSSFAIWNTVLVGLNHK